MSQHTPVTANSDQPTAIVMVGVSASGKSFQAARLVASGHYVEVNLDNCRGTVSGDPSDQSCTPIALIEHADQISKAIHARNNVVVSDTNLNKVFRDALIERFRAAGYFIIVNIFRTDYAVCLERNNARFKPVPLHAMERMRDTFNAMDKTHDNFPGVNLIQFL